MDCGYRPNMLGFCNDNLHANADCQINQDCHLGNEPGDCCHPNLRTSFKCTPAVQRTTVNCLENPISCAECSTPKEIQNEVEACPCHQQQSFDMQRQACNGHNKEFRCLTHTCPLGTIVSCSDCTREDSKHMSDACCSKELSGDHSSCYHVPKGKGSPLKEQERTCCEKKASWTEPRICRCSIYDAEDASKSCQCECGGAVAVVKDAPEQKKSVRFADEVIHIDCDKVFQSLEPEEVKSLCRCCQECVQKGKDPCLGRPVLLYELPEPKLEDISVSQKDFCWHKTPMKEMPPWHPNIKDRWKHMDVPSLTETTYQQDFKPPTVLKEKRRPVYLAPKRIERDPCQQLAEDYSTWKKTSNEQDHVHHSNCPNCDKDLHRVHLHECDTRFLPQQYRCHADGHIGDNIDAKFTLCETGDTGRSKFWWRRICSGPDEQETTELGTIPPNLMKPECPAYVTSYMHDYKPPDGRETHKFVSEDCDACKYFQRTASDPPVSLCTKNPNQPIITQRGGII